MHILNAKDTKWSSKTIRLKIIATLNRSCHIINKVILQNIDKTSIIDHDLL